jgi:hypothetical protein
MQHRLLMMLFAACVASMLAGCAAPSSISVYAVDALSGDPLPGARVEHWDKHGDKAGGVTNASGRLEGIAVKSGDRISVSHAGYKPALVEVGFGDARMMQWVPQSQREGFPHGAGTPDPSVEPLSYAPDHTLTILLRPAR